MSGVIMANEIGGYFELELPKGKEYHNNAIALNSGRNCLISTLKAYGIQKLYYPYFSCESMIYAIKRYYPEVEINFYHVDKFLNPILDSPLDSEAWLLYINYYGICTELFSSLSQKTIIDNSQSFFSKPVKDQPTFYSPRKFFGVPDGGYLYLEQKNSALFERELSYQRSSHLLKRIDLSASEGFADFKEAELSIAEQPVRNMSKLTHRILASIDYDFVIHNRKNNFSYLHKYLNQKNRISEKISLLEKSGNFVPFIYPLMISNGIKLRQQLINKNIYIPKYWPSDLLDFEKLSSNEQDFVNNLLPLPIDQRYNQEDMDRILGVIDGKI